MTALRCVATCGLVAILGAGCYAGVRGQEVVPALDGKDSDTPGLRYYLTAPYLIIEELPQGRWTGRLERGVDRSREFTIQPHTILASSTATVEYHTDGTLKSFKLEQDTTKVPEALVNALKDVQLKRIELEKAALDEQLAEARKAADTKAAAGLLKSDADRQTVLGEARQVFIYKVNGNKLERPVTMPTVTVPPTAATPEAQTGRLRSSGADRIRVVPSGVKAIVEREGGDLGQGDITGLRFFKANGDPLGADTSRELRGKFDVVDRRLEVPMQALRDSGVARIGIGTATAAVP